MNYENGSLKKGKGCPVTFRSLGGEVVTLFSRLARSENPFPLLRCLTFPNFLLSQVPILDCWVSQAGIKPAHLWVSMPLL